MRVPILLVATLVVVHFAPFASAQPTPSLITRFDAGGLDLGEGVALGSDGRIAVAGTAQRNGQEDFVTVLFDPSGSLLWARRIDEGSKDRGAGVAIDRAGNVYSAGTVRGSGDDVLLVKYSPSGHEIWALRFDKGTSEMARAIVLDKDENIIVAGSSFSANGGDGFVAKFSPDGRELWSRPANVYWLDEFFAVAVDKDGNIVAAGRVAAEGSFDAVVRKFSPAGNTQWTQYVKGAGNQEGRGVAVDASGNVIVTGTTGVARGQEITTDVFAAKFDPSGKLLWHKTYDLGGEDEGRGAVADPGGNVLVTGFARVGGNKDPFVVKIDPAGEIVWRHSPAGSGIDGTGSIAITPDGAALVIAGATQREGADFDFLAVRYDQGRPTASFSVATAKPQAGTSVSFESSSIPDRVPIVAHEWSFGDGGSSGESNPSYAYPKGGEYLVQLLVRDAWGNVDVATRQLLVAGTASAGVVPTGSPVSPDESTDPTPSTKPGPKTKTPAPGLVLVLGALALLALSRRRNG